MDIILKNPLLQKLQEQSYRPVIRLSVIAFVILMAIALAILESETINLIIIGLLVAVGGLLFLMRYPALGIVALIPASFVVPLQISVSTGTSINATIIMIGLMTAFWLFDMIVLQRQIEFVRTRAIRPLIVFLIISVLSFAVGQLPFFVFARKAPITAQLGGLALFFFSVFAFMLVAHYIKDIAWLKGLTWTYIALGTGILIIQLVPGMARYTLVIYNQGALSSLYWTWMVALCLGLALFNSKLDLKWRAGLFGLALATILVSYFVIPGWKSGWVPAVATFGVLLALRDKRLTLAIIAIGILALPFIAQDMLATEEYSYSTRVEAWAIIWEMVQVNPVLGLGPANYYWYTPLFPIRGYAVEFNSHNQFVDLLAQTGIVGTAAFIWFIVEIGGLSVRLLNKASEGFARAFVLAGLAGLVGTLVSAMLGDWFLPFVYNVGYNGFQGAVFGWIFLGGLVALEQITEKSTG